MRLFAWLLLVHFLIFAGLHRDQSWTARLAGYPPALWRFVDGGFAPLLPSLGLTGVYLLGALLVAWLLLPALRRLPSGALWGVGQLPPFLFTLLAVVVALALRSAFGWETPVDAWAPWMLASTLVTLALPGAARLALFLNGRSRELDGADFSRTARAVGLDERRVRAGVARLLRPEAVGLLAGEAVGLAVAVAIIEGLFQFPGLGYVVVKAFGTVFGGLGYQPGDLALYAPDAADAALLLLLLAGLFTLALGALAWRLDPRRGNT